MSYVLLNILWFYLKLERSEKSEQCGGDLGNPRECGALIDTECKAGGQLKEDGRGKADDDGGRVACGRAGTFKTGTPVKSKPGCSSARASSAAAKGRVECCGISVYSNRGAVSISGG